MVAMTTRVRRPASLIAAAVLAWLPPVALVVGRIAWSDTPTVVPVHWTGRGVADNWASADAAFWFCLIPGVIGALVISVLVATSGSDIPRVRGSLGLGAISALTGTIALMWFVAALIATDTSGQGVSPGWLVVAGVLFGGAVFAVAAISPRE